MIRLFHSLLSLAAAAAVAFMSCVSEAAQEADEAPVAAPGQEAPDQEVEEPDPDGVSPEAYARFCSALSKMRSGDGAGAMADLEQTVKLDPGAHLAWYHLASLQRARGKLEEAQQCLLQAVELQPDEFRYHLELGRVLLTGGKYDEGIRSLNKAAGLTESRRAAMIYEQVGKYHLRKENYAAAIEAYAKAMRADDDPVEAAKPLLALQKKYGTPEQTIETYRYLMQARPNLTAGHIEIGKLYQQLEKWDDALAAFDKYLETDPELLQRCAVLSWARKAAVRAGDYEKSRAYLSKLHESFLEVLKASESDSRLYAQLVSLFDSAGEIERAVEILTTGLDQAEPPKAVEIHKVLADIHIRDAAPARAEASLVAALELNSDDPALHAKMAAFRADMCEYEAAALELRKAMKLANGLEKLQCQVELANIYTKMAKFDKAEEELQQVVAEQPNIGRIWAVLGGVQHKAGRLEKAAESLRRAIDLGAKEDQIEIHWRIELVEVYQELDRQDDARQEREVINNLAEDTEMAFSIGYLLFQRQHYEHSLALVQSKIADDTPGRARNAAQSLTGRIYDAMGKPEEAARQMQQMVDENPDDPMILREVAGMLQQQKKYQAALDMIEKALPLQADDNDGELMARLSKADILGDMGRIDEAQQIYSNILDEHPELPVVNNNFSYFYAVHNRNLDIALEMVKKALVQEPESAAYLDTLGWVLYRKGELDGALLKINQAYSRHQDGVIAEHLGDVLAGLGRLEQALQAYKEGLEFDPDSKELADKAKRTADALRQPQAQ